MTDSSEVSPSAANGLLSYADDALAAHPLLQGPYFTGLRTGSMCLETFRQSQAQFYFAVRYFSRPMAMLTARMPTSAERRSLLHNLAEEHGFDDESSDVPRFDPALAHDLTFLTFMHRIGMDRAAMRQVREGSGVRAFNLALMGACQMESRDVAFAMLGIIEYAFADISALIGKTVVERNWLSEKQLIHYNMHAEIDKRHAAGFFDELAPSWEAGDRAAAEDGIALGLHVFDHLYRDLAAVPLPRPATISTVAVTASAIA